MTLKSRWQKAVLKWRDRLWLNHWSMDVTTEPLNLRPRKLVNEHGDFSEAARCEYSPAYRTATLTLNEAMRDRCTDDWLDQRAAHEVSHLLVAKYSCAVDDLVEDLPKAKQAAYRHWLDEINEETVTQLTQVFLYGVKRWK